jgi:hypothetical protein
MALSAFGSEDDPMDWEFEDVTEIDPATMPACRDCGEPISDGPAFVFCAGCEAANRLRTGVHLDVFERAEAEPWYEAAFDDVPW